MPLSVAIVGAGPAGFYTADALVKSGDDVAVDIIERLPAPFGLVRYGVAPDHHTTKNVARAFERTAQHAQVRYFGNVEVGQDLSLDELRALYDAVVLAVGAPLDRALGIPGEDKRGVLGAAAFVGWYNGHPDFRDLAPELSTAAAAVVGVGNVAIDVARVLVKTRAEMAASDIADHALDAIQRSAIADVHLLARRGPVEAKFTNVELREMGKLEACAPLVDPAQLPGGVGELGDRERRLKEKNLATLRSFTEFAPEDKPKRVHFRFLAAPLEVLGGERVEGLKLERTRLEAGRAVGTGETWDIACGLVITAIGYRSAAVPGTPFDEARGVVENEDGRVAPGLYAAGWIKRGPTGVIATNRPDGLAAAAHVRSDIAAGGKPGREALTALLAGRGVRWLSYADWQKIDAAEVANAAPGAPRHKFLTVAEMLAALDNGEQAQGAA